jgi:hypothetical protein
MNCIANPSGLTAARARVFQGIMDRVLTVSGDGTVSASQPASASKDPVAAIDHQYMAQDRGLSGAEPSLAFGIVPARAATTGNITPSSDCWGRCWVSSTRFVRSGLRELRASRLWFRRV